MNAEQQPTDKTLEEKRAELTARFRAARQRKREYIAKIEKSMSEEYNEPVVLEPTCFDF